MEFVIPRLNDASTDFDKLFKFWQQLSELEKPTVHFNFTHCDFLRDNAVAFLGGLIRLTQYKGGIVNFDKSSLQRDVYINLAQNGFLYALDYSHKPWDGNSVPYREDKAFDRDDFTTYLMDKWLGKGWIHISPMLKAHITQPVIEAYINVFDHAESPIGVISCGQHYPSMGHLKLTMVDFGVGIPFKVRTFLNEPAMKSSEALQWAFQPHATTKSGSGIAHGLGLKLLKSFIKENGGKLEIYTENGYVRIEGAEEKFLDRPNQFEGTLVQITLMCDDNYYKLPTEQDFDSSDDWF